MTYYDELSYWRRRNRRWTLIRGIYWAVLAAGSLATGWGIGWILVEILK